MTSKVALVTAAGSGMGAAIARKLVDLDYKITILSSSGRDEVLAAEMGGVGEPVRTKKRLTSNASLKPQWTLLAGLMLS